MKVQRVQTGVRIERRLHQVLKALAQYFGISLGDLIEGIALHAFENKSAFSKSQREKIAQLKAVYGMDYGVEAAHKITRRYLRAFEKKDWPLRQVTGSIGVASHTFDRENPPDTQTLADRLFQGADQALYQSKTNGKNQATLKTI